MRKQTAKAVLIVVCTACAVGIAAGALAWHPWDAVSDDAGDGQASQSQEGKTDGSSDESPVWVEGGTSDADYGVDGDGWAICGPSDSTFPDAATKQRWED